MRPIDADAIPYKRDIVVTERFSKFGAFNGKIVYSVTKEEIDAMPTVDAVPVVRCKDCKWYGYYSCEMGGISWMRDGNGFCDRGARMDDDHEKAD